MNAPSAILAINSLDRYTSNLIQTDTFLQGRWSLTFPFRMSIASGIPVVGAELVLSDGDGFPVPEDDGVVRVLTVTPFPGDLYQITINYPVTQNQINNAMIYQVVTTSAANQPISTLLLGQYSDLEPYSNNFTIQSPSALIYGYINRLVISQIQLTYNIPTVNLNLNDTFYIFTDTDELVSILIPYGFYYPDELAATLQTLIAANPVLEDYDMSVTFSSRDGFTFESNSDPPRGFYFPSPAYLRGNNLTPSQVQNVLKTYRLLGITFNGNGDPTAGFTKQVSGAYPNFLYTPYIDIYSDVLTNYQNVKDTNTTVKKQKGLIARVYLSGVGQHQVTGSLTALGSASFMMTSDMNVPKIIRWSPDVAVPNIDFQMLDQYGDLIPGPKLGFFTEFQMTLLCIEGRD
jgi:hypothetical protein